MPDLSGLWASLILIGVTLGLTLVLALGTAFLISYLYRLRFGRD